MAKLYNLAKMTTATTGTGTITLGSAPSGFNTFATAGVQNGDVVAYAIEDSSGREYGSGTYSSTGPTLTRSVVSSTNSNNPLNLSGSAVVFITAGTAEIIATTGTSILKGNGSGGVSNAASGTDYAPATSGTSILKGNGSGGFSSAASGTDYAPATSGSSILKGNGSGGFSNAASGTDYAPATSGTSLLKGNGSGGFSSTFAVAGGPPLTLNSHFRVWQRGTSRTASSGGGVMTADRWICKFTDASSSATVARINEFTGGALVTFTNSITAETYYIRQYVPGVMNFSNKTFTVVVDVETAETTLQYDFYINAEWNTSDRVNIVDTTAASLSNTRQIIRHTFTVSDLTGYGYTPTIDNGLDVAFRVITTTAMTSKTFKVHSISLFEGAGDFMPGFCDPEYEDQKLKRFYEAISFYVPVVGFDTASGQKRTYFPFTVGKRKGTSTTVTYADAVGNASKCSTYDVSGTRTDNVTPTAVSVLPEGVQIIINSSTVAGIGAAITANSDWL